MKSLAKWQPRQFESGWGVVQENAGGGAPWIIKPSHLIDETDLAVVCAAHNAAIEERDERSIVCSSLVNRDLEPIVQVTMGPEVAQFSVRDARQIISHMQEATEAAISDALLTRFIRDYVYQSKDGIEVTHAIGSMLLMFRDFRTAFDGQIVEAKDA